VDYSLELGREILQRTPDVLKSMLTGLPDEWTHSREAPDAWSPYQVVGHLLHVEESDWIDRTRVILEHGTSREFEPVDREAGFTRYAGWSLADLLERFVSTRAANLAELQNLVGDQELERRGIHPTFGEVTLRQLLATWVVHDLNHVNQITKTMAKQYGVAIGPWRAFLPVVDAP
jgi:uncharacterized damage-inducible protein DinB